MGPPGPPGPRATLRAGATRGRTTTVGGAIDATHAPPRAGLAASVVGGLVTGLITVIVTVSLGVLIFAGPVPSFTGNGIALVLASTAVAGLVFAARSCFRGAVAGVQDHPAVVLALMATSIGAGAVSATPDAVFATVVVTIGAATALTGIALYLLGQFRLGEFVRYIPHPVVGGFLAGTGWLLLVGSIEVMIGEVPTASRIALLWQDQALLRWVPGVVLAAAMYWWQRRSGSLLTLPAGLTVVVAGFYLVLALSGTTPGAARADGWLLGPFPAVFWSPIPLDQLTAVDRSLVLAQVGPIATLMVIATVSLALYSTGIEVAVGENLDFDRELRTAGIANLLVGLGGGAVAYSYPAVTALGYRLGVASRASATVAAGVAVTILVIGIEALTFVPVVAFGTILAFLGFSFLSEWLLDTWRSLPRSDYVVVVVIVAAIAIAGLLPGMLLGLLLALVLFVVRASRVPVVKHRFTAENYASSFDRTPEQERALQAAGPRLLVLELQGFIFFGTTARLTRAVTRLRGEVNGGFVVLDLRRTLGIDPSAVFGFIRIARTLATGGGQLVLSGLEDGTQRQLERASLDLTDGEIVVLPDLDRSVAWCEDALLREVPALDVEDQETGAAQLLELDASQLALYVERRTLERGERLIEQGQRPPGLFVVVSGQVAIALERADGSINRLRVLRPGTIVGEMSLLLNTPATATVIAETDVTVEVLTTQMLTRMEREIPHLGLVLHRRLAEILSERLATANRTIDAALD